MPATSTRSRPIFPRWPTRSSASPGAARPRTKAPSPRSRQPEGYDWPGARLRLYRARMSLITPVILVGGAGKRLWPLSRESMPKQFVPLLGKQSTFQQTLLRVADHDLFSRPVIPTNHPYRFIPATQAKDLRL